MIIRIVGLLALFTAFGTYSRTLWAQSNQWISYGPVGGYVSSLAVDPKRSNRVYVGSRSGVFRSTDGGESWQAPNPDSDGIAGIGSIVIDPSNSSTIYAGSNYPVGHLLKSTDGGLNWTAITILDPETSNAIGLYGWWIVALDSRSPATIYAGHGDDDGGSAGLFKSVDGGITWTKTKLNSLAISFLVIDPQAPEVVYVGGSGELHQSTDAGETWRVITTGFGDVTSIAIDPQASSTLYAGSYSGVFKSTDRGASWGPTLALRSGAGVWTLLVDPRNPRNIYAATGQGFHRSTDGGTSWSVLGPGLTAQAYRLALDPQSPGTLYAGTNLGVFKSTDGGSSWTRANSGLTTTTLDGVAVDAQNPGSVYAFSFDRIYKSTDGARTWNEVNSSLRARVFLFFAVHPQNGSIVYAGAFNVPARRIELFKSIDGGVNWALTSSALPADSNVSGLTFDPQNPKTLYARISLGDPPADSVALFKSTDGGASWLPLGGDTLPRSDIAALAIDPKNPNTLYAVLPPRPAGPALFKSTDGGNTWSKIATPPVSILAIDPQNTDTIYGAGSSGIFKSTNGGMSWSRVGEGIIADYPFLWFFTVRALLIDPQNPTTVYAGTSQGLYRSTDGGNSWSSVGANIPRMLTVSGLAIDPQNPSKIYAATAGGGAFATFPSPVLMLNSNEYCTGAPWNLKITSDIPNTWMNLSGTTNNVPWEVANWRRTSGDGTLTETGTFAPGSEGSHTMHVLIGAAKSNVFSFSVSRCGP